MLGDRQQLDMGEGESAAMLHEARRELRVGEPAAIRVAHPRAQVHLVGRHRRAERVTRRTISDPLVVGPRVCRRVPHPRCALGTQLHGEAQGVGLQTQAAVGTQDLVFVQLTRSDVRDEELPDTGCAEGAHRHETAVPAVEVANQPHAPRAGRPDRECDPCGAVDASRVSAEHVVQALVRALADQVQIQLAQGWQEAIRIVVLPGVAVGELEAQPVRPALGDGGAPQPGAERLHGHRPAGAQQADVGGIRVEGSHHSAVAAQDRMRIVVHAGDEARRIVGGWGERVAAGRCHRSNHTLRWWPHVACPGGPARGLC